MILISKVREYAAQVKAQLPEFKHDLVVIDDSQLTSKLDELPPDELIFVVVIPSHVLTGENVDDVRAKDFMIFMVLQKNDQDEGHDKFLEAMEKCQLAIIKLVKKMLADKSGADQQCGIMRQLEISSTAIDPVWALANCDGYEMNFKMNTSIY